MALSASRAVAVSARRPRAGPLSPPSGGQSARVYNSGRTSRRRYPLAAARQELPPASWPPSSKQPAAPRRRSPSALTVPRPGAPHQRASSRVQNRLSRRHLGTLTAYTGEVPQPGPVHRGLRRGDAGTVSRHPDAERGWGDRAGHRRRHRYRLAVDADRDLGHVGADLDFLRGQHAQSGGTPAADQVSGLPGVADLDADYAEHAAI